MAKKNEMFWTALPNGLVEGTNRVKISVLATLILEGSPTDTLKDADYSVFKNWAATLAALPGRQWEVTYGSAPPVFAAFDRSDLNPDMWGALFSPDLPVRSRKSSAEKYKQTEVVSYPSATLETEHIDVRAKLAVFEMIGEGHERSMLREDIGKKYQTMNLFLQPGLGGPSANILSASSTDEAYRKEIDASKLIQDYVDKLINRTDKLLSGRLRRDMTRLNHVPGTRLKAAAVLALVDQQVKLRVSEDSQTTGGMLADWQSELRRPEYSTAVPSLAKVAPYLQFLLYHRIPEMKDDHAKAQPPCEYDFHKLLAMIGQFPVLLRPLGLVFDIEVSGPAPGTGEIKVKLSGDVEGVKQTSLKTAFISKPPLFCAQPQSNKLLCKEPKPETPLAPRMMNLAADGFRLSAIDGDSATLKYTTHAQALDRAEEFRSADTPDDYLSKPPSTRTLGVSLLYDKRAEILKTALTNSANAILADSVTREGALAGSAKEPTLFAEDLTLGYRVDVLDSVSRKWHSLCERTATYDFIDGKGSLRNWVAPAKWHDKEEGFIQWSATIPHDAQADNEKQLQAHPSVFLWTGWSLSVRFPGREINPIKNGVETRKPLRMIPNFEVKPKTLPSLRFGVEYKARCRAVDLAGNSLAANETVEYGPAAGPLVFDRWEPINSPVVLAADFIDPQASPGEQMDHLVIRDGRGKSDRFLVPPRTHQRFAEMHGKFDRSGLVDGAFAHVELKRDGAFPQFSDSDKASLAERNAYFLYRSSYNQRPECSYFPDPLVEYFRIQAWRLDCLGRRVRYFDIKMPVFKNGLRDWPQALASRLRIVNTGGNVWEPGSAPGTPSVQWQLLNEEEPQSPRAPALHIPLRKAETIELEVSSVPPSEVDVGARSVSIESLLAISNILNGTGYRTRVAPSEYASLFDGYRNSTTPSHAMTLVHAVKKPLLDLAFDRSFSIQRLKLDEKAGGASGLLQVDWFSTSRLVCQARWTDWVDDITKPGPEEILNTQQAFEIKVHEVAKCAPGQHECEPAEVQHVFRDTHFHDVAYSLTATSRFRDYYEQDPKPSNDSKYQIETAAPLRQLVKNSTRPAAPSIVYVIPAFEWTDQKDGSSRRHSRVGALRVYLNRPWFSSGNGELLGVVYSQSTNPDAKIQDFITQWGVDPIWRGGTLESPSPQQADFMGQSAQASGCYLAEFDKAPNQVARVDVVGFEPKYDNTRRLWYADVQIDPRKAYYPFVRLALVRFQPNSISPDSGVPFNITDPNTYADARISQVVVSDFAQLSPTRWAHVQKIDDKHYKLTVSGVSYDACMSGAKGPSYFRLAVQREWDRTDEDIGWLTEFEIDPTEFIVNTSNQVTTWEATISFESHWWKPDYRVLIQEFEQIQGDSDEILRDPKRPRAVSRLVYADSFELR